MSSVCALENLLYKATIQRTFDIVKCTIYIDSKFTVYICYII
jgi:hypothetical protein